MHPKTVRTRPPISISSKSRAGKGRKREPKAKPEIEPELKPFLFRFWEGTGLVFHPLLRHSLFVGFLPSEFDLFAPHFIVFFFPELALDDADKAGTKHPSIHALRCPLYLMLGSSAIFWGFAKRFSLPLSFRLLRRGSAFGVSGRRRSMVAERAAKLYFGLL